MLAQYASGLKRRLLDILLAGGFDYERYEQPKPGRHLDGGRVGDQDDLVLPHAQVGEWVCFSVSDTGAGMDEKQLTRLFDPFYTTKEMGKGWQ